MDELTNEAEAIELLQQLGLKEYEAKCFVALSRLPSGTAKEVSEHSEVPRTRVYDATRVLESKGLVEVQHSSPQQFRAVSIAEATRTLRQEYENRTERLQEALEAVEPIEVGEDEEVTHEVWALSGTDGIGNRTNELVDEAGEEVVLVLGGGSAVTDDLFDRLSAAHERGVRLLVGTVDSGLQDEIRDRLPGAEVFVSGLEWLDTDSDPGDDTEITRLLLVDRGTILVSTSHGGEPSEQAVFGRGFDNGLVTIVRRLMATGLLPTKDPGRGAEQNG